MSKFQYYQKLKDPRWQRRRLEVLNNYQFSCLTCGSSDKTLHVHHKRYVAGREPWEYPDEDLTCLCEECHERVSAAEKILKAQHSNPLVNEAAVDFKDYLSLLLSECKEDEIPAVFEYLEFCMGNIALPDRHQMGVHEKPLSVMVEMMQQDMIKSRRARLNKIYSTE